MGYSSLGDFLNSLLHINSYKPITLMSITLGTLATLFEKFIGLEPIVYLAFIGLLAVEFFTGIQVSLKAGKKLESKRFGRFIFKIGAYSIIIGSLNIFAKFLPPFTINDMSVSFYEWLYYVILNMVIVQLFISVFENGSKLGWKEASRISRFLYKYFDKWFKPDNE